MNEDNFDFIDEIHDGTTEREEEVEMVEGSRGKREWMFNNSSCKMNQFSLQSPLTAPFSTERICIITVSNKIVNWLLMMRAT